MKRAKHSLSHYKLLSCDMGELVPVGLVEVLPGDTIQQATSALIRVAPLLSPVMHPVHVRIHHWFIPHRIIWDEWEDFITGGPDGDSTPDFPVVVSPPSTGFAVGSLADYMGIPVGVPNLEVSALPFRAYGLIWNEWYRDQDLQNPRPLSKLSGTDSTTDVSLANVSWEKDYFTSSRPWPQKGPDVTIPFAGEGLVVPKSGATNLDVTATYRTSVSGNKTLQINHPSLDGSSSGQVTVQQVPGAGSTAAGQVQTRVSLTPADMAARLGVDLSGVSATSINDLREAFAIQRYQEARARYGSRYTEYLRYLGVRSSDARLQRPEYLGGGRQTIQFSEVLQTGPDTDGDGVANLRGHGIGALRSNRYRRFFEEHGYIVTCLSVRPKTIYTQALHRTWNRRVKEDFFQKELQHIGQQEVLNKELYAAHSSPDGVFGYQDRYDEYRRSESMVCGEFRTTALDHWHYARIFSTPPALNADFVKALPTKRVNAVQTEDVLYLMVNHSIQARRLVASTGKSFIF